ncbi:MAG: acetate kinase [Verrucomicrobiales bacterium]
MSEFYALIVNAGSSSLKLAVINAHSGQQEFSVLAQRIGTEEAVLDIAFADQKLSLACPQASVAGALQEAWNVYEQQDDLPMIQAVGHRVVHGGELFQESILIDHQVLLGIEECSALAPLHNPANLDGIQASLSLLPSIPHVAVFDTAFHHTMKPHAYLYAVPYAWYQEHAVRRYGFHGSSHRYVAEECAKRLQRDDLQLLTAHLGNGCSACAIRAGQSVDTTMGLTPLEGLMMGTRSGDVDPQLHSMLAQRTGWTLDKITSDLTKKSGLLGVSGISNDMRSLSEARERGSTQASLAIDLFCYRVAKGLLGISASLDRVDAVVFTGGIGENSPDVRSRVVSHLKVLGAEISSGTNEVHGRNSQGNLSPESTQGPAIMVIPTNEELMIARETLASVVSSL